MVIKNGVEKYDNKIQVLRKWRHAFTEEGLSTTTL
jgi:hypothetical protein